ncbi:hypothetical protein DFH28DRAFT_1139577 [Melampsora americana]|nr:hypothetical protein DFH28DRAFT_1139577 [Melampsora americana]
MLTCSNSKTFNASPIKNTPATWQRNRELAKPEVPLTLVHNTKEYQTNVVADKFMTMFEQPGQDPQIETVVALVNKQHAFLRTGTGFGKSQIPEAYAGLHQDKPKYIVLTIVPLDLLGNNQASGINMKPRPGKYDAGMKVLAIKYLNKGQTPRQVQHQLRSLVTIRTIQRWNALYKPTSSVVRNPENYESLGQIPTLSDEDRESMLGLMEKDPTLYLDEYRDAVYQATGVWVSLQTIASDLKLRLHVTVKKGRTVHPKQSATKRANFLHSVAALRPDMLMNALLLRDPSNATIPMPSMENDQSGCLGVAVANASPYFQQSVKEEFYTCRV